MNNILQQDIKNLIEILCFQVKEDCSLEDEAAELHQGMHGEGGDVGLAPPVGPLLHILLEPDPPRRLLPLITALIVQDQLLQLGEKLMGSVVLTVIIWTLEEKIF